MQDNINILDELKEAGSTVLVNAGRENYYSLPVDYFNDFARNLLSRIFIESISPVNIYTVPAGYFENFPAIILEKLGIIDESETFLNKAETMPYAVPDGYFNTLANNILQKIKTQSYSAVQQELQEIAPLLSKIPKTNVYSVPDVYLNTLANNILQKIKAEGYSAVQQELQEIAPLLSKMPKTNVYSVPDGYFNHFAPLKIEVEKPAAKVIPLGGRARKSVTYAAAACIAILFGGGFLYLFRGPVNIPPSLASVNIEIGISALSDDQISNYLKEDNSIAVYTNQNSDEQKLDVKTLLDNTSDEEIQEFLNNTEEPGETNKGI